MKGKDKFIYISGEKERYNNLELARTISESDWVDRDTVIVNCFPDYSASVCQILNHKLSYVNDNELLEQVGLEIPYPTMSQVWDRYTFEYPRFDVYLESWFQRNINSDLKYLFVTNILQGKEYGKISQMLRSRYPATHYRFACVYCDSGTNLVPDYFVKSINQKEQGRILHEWENSNNPNWPAIK